MRFCSVMATERVLLGQGRVQAFFASQRRIVFWDPIRGIGTRAQKIHCLTNGSEGCLMREPRQIDTRIRQHDSTPGCVRRVLLTPQGSREGNSRVTCRPDMTSHYILKQHQVPYGVKWNKQLCKECWGRGALLRKSTLQAQIHEMKSQPKTAVTEKSVGSDRSSLCTTRQHSKINFRSCTVVVWFAVARCWLYRQTFWNDLT